MSFKKWLDIIKPLKRKKYGLFFVSYKFQESRVCSVTSSMVSLIDISMPIEKLIEHITEDFPKEIRKMREINEDSVVVITSFNLIREYSEWRLNRDSPFLWFLGFFYKPSNKDESCIQNS